MRLSNERLRMTTSKRNPVAENQNRIRKVYHSKFGMDRLAMLVVTSIAGPERQFYGFRRKLNGAFYAINRRIQIHWYNLNLEEISYSPYMPVFNIR